ncbi:MAG TPA: ABC transporter substrate-binding protein [Ramlibacter sp.]|uniref:ABC transporter substrate-binding protein n=1 Tax=Ramlibacter sp. TaxID=1917967 RepID=UPI002B53889B|nr:ABC transporter substrate-binding protein [Ramlibacter sp.]HVZ45508.1 ABC transporter substrate-binding protein [Ramlibacter sp.]
MNSTSRTARHVARTAARCLTVVALALMSLGARSQSAQPIRLGGIFHLSGPAATFGLSNKTGAELAVKQINDAGGIGGRQVVLVVGDDKSDPTAAVTEVSRLISQEKVVAIIGSGISHVTMAFQPLVTQAKVLNISGSSLLMPLPQAPYSFASFSAMDTNIKAMVDYAVKTHGAKTFALLGNNGSNSKLSVDAMKKELESRRLTITGIQEYAIAARDMVPQLLDLRGKNPDVLFLFSSLGADTGNVHKGLAQLNWSPKVIGDIGTGYASEGAIAAAGGKEAFRNTVALNFKAFTYCPGDPTPTRTSRLAEQLKQFAPDVAPKLALATAGMHYDAVNLFKAAVEGSAGKTDGPTLAAWIESNTGKYKGIVFTDSASSSTHFLSGLPDLAMMHIETSRPDDRMMLRADCK